MALTVTVSCSVVIVPEAGVSVSQETLLVATQLRSRVRLLVRVTFWAAGSVPPAVAEKDNELGASCNAHAGFAAMRNRHIMAARLPMRKRRLRRLIAPRSCSIVSSSGMSASKCDRR